MTGRYPALSEVLEPPGPWTHRRVSANGARFHVAEAGQGPLVLLVHGFPEFWWTWRHQIPLLAERGYRVAAMDLRGYGGSDKTPRGYDPFTLTSDIAGVVRSLGERRAVVVGHGWGGWSAWAMAVLRPDNVTAIASVSMAHPRRLREGLRHPRQIIASAYLFGYQPPLMPERRLLAAESAEVARLLRAWSAKGSAFPDHSEADRYRAAMRIWPAPHCALEYHRWVIRSMPRADGRRFMARMAEPITVPVLHVQGAEDPIMLTSTSIGSAEHVRGPYTWQLMDGAGHFPHEERPERFGELLARWLDEVSPRRLRS